MVSVADEQGRLVLMGVDATYCVVDEVDTTASLHDHYLQQAIEDAETKANKEAEDAEDTKDGLCEVDDPFLKEAIKKAAEDVALKTDLLMKGKTRRKKRGNSSSNLSGEARQDTFEAAESVIDSANSGLDMNQNSTEQKGAASGQSLLRVALLCQPVSLREPGAPGRLNFCLKRSTSGESELQRNADVADSSMEAGSEGRCPGSATAKPKTERPKTKHKSASPSKSTPNPKTDVPELAASESGDQVNGGENAELKSKLKRPREKPYQCGVCSRWFGCKSHVVEHMRTHTGEKPFQCPLCHKRFSQKSNIYQHMNTHTQQRPFRCNDCGKDFMYRGSLYKHKRLHTGERPYTCGICERRFTHASQLFEHLRTHTNERPFKCSVCGRAFAHSGTMHRHQRNHFSQVKGKGAKDQNGHEVEVTETEFIEVAVGQEVENNDLVSDLEGGKESVKDINHNSELYTPQMDQDMETGRSNRHRADAVNQSRVESAEDSGNAALASAGVNAEEETQSKAISDQKHQQRGYVESNKTVIDSRELVTEECVSSSSEVAETTTSLEHVTSSADIESDLPSALQEASSSDSGADPTSTSKLKVTVKIPREVTYSSKRKSKITPKDPNKPKRTRIETPDRKVFSCNICGHSFCHKRSVKRHKLDKHPEAMDDLTLGDDSVGKNGPSAEVQEITEQVAPVETRGAGKQVDSKEGVRSEASLLKSLLTMTRMNCSAGHQGYNVPDLAALAIRPLGEASASLQAIAQICSQEQNKDIPDTASPSSQGQSLSTQSQPPGRMTSKAAGEENPPKVPKLCIKTEPSSSELPEYSVSTVVDSTTAGVPEGAQSESGVQTALDSVVVKMEPADEYECA